VGVCGKLEERYNNFTHYYPKNFDFLRKKIRHMNINSFGFLVVIKIKSRSR